MKKKTSILWKIPKSELDKVVKNNSTFSSILKIYDLLPKGGNTRTLKNRLDHDNIDYSHIIQGKSSNKNRKFFVNKIPLIDVLVENSSYNRGRLKNRLINQNLLENKCSGCGLDPFWNGNKLILQLDHINGISNDNRLNNLRLLCPNCHSQTDTFANKKRRI